MSRVSAAGPRGHGPTFRALALLAAAGAVLALAACGGSSPASGTDPSSQSSERAAELKLTDFARCLREHGVDATTSAGPLGQGQGLRITGSPSSGGPVKLQGAQAACAKYRPVPKKIDLSPQQKVEQEEGVQKFAKCMREHGIHVEASATEGHISIGIHSSPTGGGPNPESPGFQAAQRDCQRLLPGPRGGSAKHANESGSSGAELSTSSE